MSTVKATNFQNASSATANMVTDASGNVSFGGTAAMSSSFLRNRIINGDMRIDQRNAGAEVNPAVTATYYLDRWQATSSVASKYKIGQNAGAVTPPTGYTNYLGLTSLSSYTVGASDIFVVRQPIEGLNVSDLAWGTASAATVTVSFWVRSSLTGTFGGSLRNSDGTRSNPFTYTISVANTWEQKTVTVAGDTSGTWLTTNGIGIILIFSIGTGSTFSGTAGAWASANYLSATGATSVVGTSGATFYVTGVQLEVGTVATPFERQIFNNQVAQCQRYFETTYFSVPNAVPTNASGGYIPIPSAAVASAAQYAFIPFKVTKRASPTVTSYSYTSSTSSAASTVTGTDLAASSGVPFGAGASHFWLVNSSGGSITPTSGGFLIHYAATSEL